MAGRGARPRITWGAGFANVLEFDGPVGSAINYALPAEGSEFTAIGSSGDSDSWIYGPDQLLEVTVRWIPRVDTLIPRLATGWDGWDGTGYNLVRNGDAEAGGKALNWSGVAGFDRVAGDAAPPNGLWVWEATGNGVTAIADDAIPVSPHQAYNLSLWGKRVSVSATPGLIYAGFACYDLLGRRIQCCHVYAPNGLTAPTVLALDAKEGDTTITVASGTGFAVTGNDFVALNTADDGSDLPNFQSVRYSAKVGNVLTVDTTMFPAGLTAAYTAKAGTKVRYQQVGGTYQYALITALAGGSLPASWTQYTGTLGAPAALGASPGITTMVGTRAVRPVLLAGNGGVGATNTSRWDDFRIERTGSTGLGWRAFLDWAREMNVFRWYPDADHPALYYPMLLVAPLMDAGVTLERGARYRSLALRMRTSDRTVITGY